MQLQTLQAVTWYLPKGVYRECVYIFACVCV